MCVYAPKIAPCRSHKSVRGTITPNPAKAVVAQICLILARNDFTIGNRKNYLQFIMDYGVPENWGKQPPNERFRWIPRWVRILTMADAERRIQEAGYRDFAVFNWMLIVRGHRAVNRWLVA